MSASQPKKKKASAPKGITEEQIARALIRHKGRIVHAAEALGINYHTLQRRIEANEALQNVRAYIDEKLLDQAERVVTSKIAKGDSNDAWKWLNTKGRKRGFGTPLPPPTLTDAQLLAIVASFGGNPTALRAFRDAIDPPLDITPAQAQVQPPVAE